MVSNAKWDICFIGTRTDIIEHVDYSFNAYIKSCGLENSLAAREYEKARAAVLCVVNLAPSRNSFTLRAKGNFTFDGTELSDVEYSIDVSK